MSNITIPKEKKYTALIGREELDAKECPIHDGIRESEVESHVTPSTLPELR